MNYKNPPCLVRIGLYLVLVLCCSSAIASSSETATLSIVYDTFAPYIDNVNDKAEGLYVDVLTEALENRLGVPVRFEWQPWSRAQFSVEKGYADAMVTVVTPARLAYAETSKEPVAASETVLFTRADHPRFEQMKEIRSRRDLGDYRILTYLGDGWAKEFLSEFEVDFGARDFSHVLEKLERGRGDLFLQGRKVVQHYISELQQDVPIVQVPGVELDRIEFHLLIGKSSPFLPLLPRIDQVLREMRTDGTIEDIRKKHGGIR